MICTMYQKINILRQIIFYGVIVAVTLLITINLSNSSLTQEEIQEKINFFRPAIQKMIDNDIDSSFIYSIFSNPEIKFNEKYIRINVIGFLKKTDYSEFYNENSVRKSKEFLITNAKKLADCEQKFKIPKEVIAAIIWVETKHGDYLGENNILSVYLSTAMADLDEYIALNKQLLRKDFEGNEVELAELDKKIEKRALKKAKWAINELKCLSKIHNSGMMDIAKLRGSWAGAFGLPQFLPSSYLRCAVDGNNDNIIDLYNIDDAIFSVANYLKMAGWSNNPEDKSKAIHSYNSSNDYVNAVLTLAAKLSNPSK